MDQLEKLKAAIFATATKVARTDDEDFIVDDCCAGNVDDAFYCGVEDGEISFARSLMNLISE